MPRKGCNIIIILDLVTPKSFTNLSQLNKRNLKKRLAIQMEIPILIRDSDLIWKILIILKNKYRILRSQSIVIQTLFNNGRNLYQRYNKAWMLNIDFNNKKIKFKCYWEMWLEEATMRKKYQLNKLWKMKESFWTTDIERIWSKWKTKMNRRERKLKTLDSILEIEMRNYKEFLLKRKMIYLDINR